MRADLFAATVKRGTQMNNKKDLQWALSILAALLAGYIFILGTAPWAHAAPAVLDAAPDVTFDIDADDDIDTMAEIIATAQFMVNEYPHILTQGVIFETAVLDRPLAYASASGNKIKLAEHYASDPEGLARNVSADVDSGYHPPLGWCTPAQFLVIHETVHVMDNMQGHQPRLTLHELVSPPSDLAYEVLVAYSFNPDGSLNAAEALAEAGASVICNGGNEYEQVIAGLVGI